MNNKLNLKGVYTALVTPFTEYGNVDYTALENLVNYQIENGIDGLVPCGTTGESPTLSHEEHDRVIAQTIKFSAGRVPVIAGTGSNATNEAISLSQHAQDAGVDAVLLVNPYYNKPTQKGLLHHFKAIAESISIPCILYNIKGRTGVNLETQTLLELIDKCPNIYAVKEASGDINQMCNVIESSPKEFKVLSGDDNLAVDLIKKGGDGVISVASNLFPSTMRKLIHATLDGDYATADDMNKKLAPFFKSCFVETNPIPIKTALAHYGYCQESFRLPLCTLSTDENRKTLIDSCEAVFDLIKKGQI